MRIPSILFLAFAAACTGTPAAPGSSDGEPAQPAAADAGGTAEPSSDAASAATDAAADPAADPEGQADADADASDLPSFEKLDEAKGKIHAMMAKEAALTAVSDLLGEPAAASETELMWKGREGDACKALKVQLMGDFTGNVTVDKTDCAAGAAE